MNVSRSCRKYKKTKISLFSSTSEYLSAALVQENHLYILNFKITIKWIVSTHELLNYLGTYWSDSVRV
jgi:hypothetical protein